MTHIDITLERFGNEVLTKIEELASLGAAADRARGVFPEAIIRARYVPEDGRTHFWPIVSAPKTRCICGLPATRSRWNMCDACYDKEMASEAAGAREADVRFEEDR